MAAMSEQHGTVRVWDIGVRLFHWSLLTCVAGAWLFVDPRSLHRWLGYCVIGLIAFRLIWGLVGSRHARFTDFIKGPRTVLAYLRAMVAGTERRHLGHNPAGAAMIVALLLTLAGICTTGIMMGMDAYFGVSWVEHWHEGLVNGLLILVAMHLVGVVTASWRHRENLVASMVHGHKDAHETGAEP
ncbi:Cytochrome b [Loktanella sp. DSM 29012]|uniref:cytochrome b/b6 domain-containing protein n=1 Tax=Loktanella sp. DSM 29012 TaxID=1881056 RepID=UPI0008C956BE|nr:cytochrome b/b6 domain-containing protein [Loktanella sp. DSM 29012]SEP63833.1 Cytochrome b [Loktanella sp. DSM 29012]